jgi:hypothetical protein
VLTVDKLTTFMRRTFLNMRVSTSWNPLKLN